MIYRLKQNMWSLTEGYTITDEGGAPVFLVRGKMFSLGDKLTLSDASGAEVLYIEQKIFSWGPTYQVYQGGQLVAVVKKELFTFFHAAFDVDAGPPGPSPEDMVATGDFMAWNYSFVRRGQTVARVSTQFFHMTDTYGVEIEAGENVALILGATVIIDRCKVRERESHH